MIDSPSNSDGFEEVMIYSQESPKSGETFRDFDWANFLFLKYLNILVVVFIVNYYSGQRRTSSRRTDSEPPSRADLGEWDSPP